MTVSDVHGEFSRRLGHLGRVVVAGGAVRDELMGRTPKDFDVFLLGVGFADADREAALEAVSELPSIDALEFHKSEPFLAANVMLNGCNVQVMCSPHKTTADLLDTFDWNVSRFAFDGECHALEDIANIATGKPLRLHRVTYPQSTLRRGFRFSERFGMEFQRADVVELCRRVVATGEPA